MRLPTTDREAIDRLKNHFLGKQIPGVGTWGELDALRGWKDDFLGDSLHEQYTAQSSGAGSSGALQSNAHGGMYALIAGAGAGFYHRLWLGDAADGYATLDADLGWVMMARLSMNSIAGVTTFAGAQNIAGNNYVWLYYQAGFSPNWLLLTALGGVQTVIDTGVAADTNMHWHCLEVSSGKVNYYIDGTLVATSTTNVPTIVLTAMVMCYAQAAAVKYILLDYWGVIPRNLP